MSEEFDATIQPDPLPLRKKSIRTWIWEGITGGDKPDNAELKAAILSRRRFAGYVAMIFGVVGIVALGWHSFRALVNLTSETGGLSDTVILATFLAHAIITVALVMFFYQLMRAGERLMLPHWLGTKPEDVEVMRIMVGVEPPMRSALKMVREVSEAVRPLTKLAEVPKGKPDP